MEFLLRCTVLLLAVVGVAHLMASALMSASHRSDRPEEPATDRANRLWRLQALPLMIALWTLLVGATALVRFESRDAAETIGWVLYAAALCGAAVMLMTLWRVMHLGWQTARLRRLWLSQATRIDLPGVTMPAFAVRTGFPIVAVIGVLRPRLIIDMQVIHACPAQELAAITAHERAHVQRRDNLRRILADASPRWWFSRDVTDAWRQATEEAADDLASMTGAADVRFHLASALLRVSRLATQEVDAPGWPQQLPASALYRGEGVERRVRRLMAHSPAATRTRTMGMPILIAAIATVLCVQQELHDVIEHLITVLP